MTDAWKAAVLEVHPDQPVTWGRNFHPVRAQATKIADRLELPELDGVESYDALRAGMIAYIRAFDSLHDQGKAGGPSLAHFAVQAERWFRRRPAGVYSSITFSNEVAP